jgi:rSAM/selenodomain-associated transferase 2
MEPRLSIIIPTLNEEKHIGPLLDSLLALPGVEIIVSDGGSSDATLEICRRYPVRLLSSPAGRSNQLNAGAQCATGEILLFMHADSRVESTIVNEIRQADRQGRLWGCCSLRFSEEIPIFQLIAFCSNLRARLGSICYGDQGIYCQRGLFQAMGGFPTTVFLEDIKFSQQLKTLQRAYQLKSIITTSTRRFRTQGVGKALGKMQMVKLLYQLGVKPERLRKWYQAGQEVSKCEPQ